MSVELPDVIALVRLTLEGEVVQVRLDEEVTTKFTVLVNPLIPFTIMVDAPDKVPGGGTIVVGLALTVKS